MVSATSIKPIQRFHFTFEICRTVITIIHPARHGRSMNGQLQVQPPTTICRLHLGPSTSSLRINRIHPALALQRHRRRHLFFTNFLLLCLLGRSSVCLSVCLFVSDCFYVFLSLSVQPFIWLVLPFSSQSLFSLLLQLLPFPTSQCSYSCTFSPPLSPSHQILSISATTSSYPLLLLSSFSSPFHFLRALLLLPFSSLIPLLLLPSFSSDRPVSLSSIRPTQIYHGTQPCN